MTAATALLLMKSGATARTEIKIVIGTVALVVALPILAVGVTMSSGLEAVSNALALLDPATEKVTLYDANGKPLTDVAGASVWPARGFVSTEFGEPHMPYQAHHTGMDIAGRTGEPLTPFMRGTVIKTVEDVNNATGFGKYVYIDHGNGVTAYYGHMSQISVQTGQAVTPGDAIGLMGSTGHSTGPHVHFEVRVASIPVDPRTFVTGNPVR